MAVPAIPSLTESPGLSVDPFEQIRRSSGAQMAAVLHFHEPEDEAAAGRGGDVDEIRAGPLLVLVLTPCPSPGAGEGPSRRRPE